MVSSYFFNLYLTIIILNSKTRLNGGVKIHLFINEYLSKDYALFAGTMCMHIRLNPISASLICIRNGNSNLGDTKYCFELESKHAYVITHIPTNVVTLHSLQNSEIPKKSLMNQWKVNWTTCLYRMGHFGLFWDI